MGNGKTVQKLNLHVGCGDVYYPGYINIDINENSIADLIAHAIYLPIKDNSVASIKAYHVIEHFDWVDIKFLFNEWYRVLSRGGEIIIEVPDLEKGLKELNKCKTLDEIVRNIQWIFGIDVQGMQHKSGVTFEIIRNLLHEAGFENITRKAPQTHLYGKGLRVTCKKSVEEVSKKNKIVNSFKTKVYAFMVSNQTTEKTLLESNHMNQIYEILGSLDEISDKRQLIKTILDLAIANPSLALDLLDILSNEQVIDPNSSEKCKNLLKYLKSISFQKKLFILWKKRRKIPGKFTEEFQRFNQEIKNKLVNSLENSEIRMNNFSYLANLEIEFPLLFFDKYYILKNANLFFNRGIRYFGREDYIKALNALHESLSYSKDNFLVYWNIARLLALSNDSNVKEYYMIAYDLIQDKSKKRDLKMEMEDVLVNKDLTRCKGPYIIVK